MNKLSKENVAKMYHLAKFNLIVASGSLEDIKAWLFNEEKIKIEPHIWQGKESGWDVKQYNRDIYVDKSPKWLFGFGDCYKSKQEVFGEVNTINLIKNLADYKLLKN